MERKLSAPIKVSDKKDEYYTIEEIEIDIGEIPKKIDFLFNDIQKTSKNISKDIEEWMLAYDYIIIESCAWTYDIDIMTWAYNNVYNNQNTYAYVADVIRNDKKYMKNTKAQEIINFLINEG